jgi:hypothetical protein
VAVCGKKKLKEIEEKFGGLNSFLYICIGERKQPHNKSLTIKNITLWNTSTTLKKSSAPPANVVSRPRQKSNITLTPGTREKVEMDSSSTTAPSVDVIT